MTVKSNNIDDFFFSLSLLRFEYFSIFPPSFPSSLMPSKTGVCDYFYHRIFVFEEKEIRIEKFYYLIECFCIRHGTKDPLPAGNLPIIF